MSYLDNPNHEHGWRVPVFERWCLNIFVILLWVSSLWLIWEGEREREFMFDNFSQQSNVGSECDVIEWICQERNILELHVQECFPWPISKIVRSTFSLPLFLFYVRCPYISPWMHVPLSSGQSIHSHEAFEACNLLYPRVPVFERWCSSVDVWVLLIVSEDMSECAELCKWYLCKWYEWV